MPTDPTSSQAARRRLLHLQRTDGGWSYRPASPASAVEPTAMASLALLATDSADDRAAPLRGGQWIAARARRPDGSTVVSPGSEVAPGWTTSYALLLWNALGGFAVERSGAVAWLLATRGKPVEPVPHNPMGHDVTLVGWPWVADTHSWVEPTAASILALAPSVPLDQPRMREGVRVLLDRAIATGGWNLGNPVVFGQTLRSLPGPTGLALLALARVARKSSPQPIIQPAVTYLGGVVRQTNAPSSLGWAWLGLRAWGARPDAAAVDHLARATERALARNSSAVELAMILLASGDRSMHLLGLTPRGESEFGR